MIAPQQELRRHVHHHPGHALIRLRAVVNDVPQAGEPQAREALRLRLSLGILRNGEQRFVIGMDV